MDRGGRAPPTTSRVALGQSKWEPTPVVDRGWHLTSPIGHASSGVARADVVF
jgi:hypothetical protein